jgi:transposase-like protein
VLDEIAQNRRNTKAAKRFPKQGGAPKRMMRLTEQPGVR